MRSMRHRRVSVLKGDLSTRVAHRSRPSLKDRDSRSNQSRWEQEAMLETTATLYIGERFCSLYS